MTKRWPYILTVTVLAVGGWLWWDLGAPYRMPPEQRAELVLSHELELYGRNPHLGTPIQSDDLNGITGDQALVALQACTPERWDTPVEAPRPYPFVYRVCRTSDVTLAYEVYFSEGRTGPAATTMIACPTSTCEIGRELFPNWI